jgi:small subunit ribosomal protein S6
VQESDLNKVTGKVSGVIGELGGKVDKEEIWGRRKLAYPIQKQDFATYVTLNFDLPSLKVIEFERDIKHTEGMLRHLLIVKDMGSEEITLTAAEIADLNEIGAVTGGEKSFEAIVGETEESKSLMAKREEEKEPASNKPVESVKEETVIAEEPKVEKAKTDKKAKVENAEEPKTEKVKETAKKSTKKAAKEENEVERLSKLNDELDDILKDEL